MDMTEHLRIVFTRDLEATEHEVMAYPDDASLWVSPEGIPNSAGTLALHMAGNLHHFIGAVLGGTGYVRDREEEFAARDLPREELVARLQATRATVARVLAEMDPARLEEPFPLELRVGPLNTGRFLLHLATHLAYHLGQVDYHRRITTGDASGVSAQAMEPLA